MCGAQISRVGVERPTTDVPVAYIHADHSPDETFPLSDVPIRGEHDETRNHGTGKHLVVSPHNRDDIAHLALVDTPDLDSLDLANRRMTEDLYRMADLIVFVTSQEKYADEIPSQALDRLGKEGKPCFFLFNKADPANTKEEIIDFFQERGIAINHERVWFTPYLPSPTLDLLAGQGEFTRFSVSFFETLQKDTSTAFLVEQRKQRIVRLNSSIDSFLALAENENKAGHKWLQQLTILFEEKSKDLFNQFETQYFCIDRTGHCIYESYT